MAGIDFPKPCRAPWDGFPDIVIVADQSAVKKHPEYEQAKAGNVNDAAPAAKRLAVDLVGAAALNALRDLPLQHALLLPVHAIEGGGLNRIPAAFAELLAEKLDLEVEDSIVQANIAAHTGASGWERIARPAIFEGSVEAGRNHILVDDFVGQGGTLANLRGYIMRHGGLVRGAVTLTGRAHSARLALQPQILAALEAKHGTQISGWWRRSFGYGFESLTQS